MKGTYTIARAVWMGSYCVKVALYRLIHSTPYMSLRYVRQSHYYLLLNLDNRLG
jgi:hypothetical protein